MHCDSETSYLMLNIWYSYVKIILFILYVSQWFPFSLPILPSPKFLFSGNTHGYNYFFESFFPAMQPLQTSYLLPQTLYQDIFLKMTAFPPKIFRYWQYSVPPKFDRAHSFFFCANEIWEKVMCSASLFCLKVNLWFLLFYLSSFLYSYWQLCWSSISEIIKKGWHETDTSMLNLDASEKQDHMSLDFLVKKEYKLLFFADLFAKLGSQLYVVNIS